MVGGRVSVSIEALGSPQACRTGILALGRRGRHVQVGLLPPAEGRADVPMERVIGWELNVSAATGWPPPTTPPARRRGERAARPRRPARAREPLGLQEAGAALTAMATAPSTGIVLVDPSR